MPGSDWLGRCTRDPGREALLFADGVFARMPATVDPAVVAAEPEGEAWWVVMRDVSDELLDDSTPLTREENRFVLGPRGRDVGRRSGTRRCRTYRPCTTGSRSPSRRSPRSSATSVDILPKQFEAAWEAFGEAVDADVGAAVLELVDDVTPLADALAARGTTLIHGDLRDENIAMPDGRLVLLDFGLATQGHPAAELAWYMVHDVWRIEATHDEVVEDFRARARRARRSGRARARPDLAASCSTDGSSATARLCTPTPPNENGLGRSSTGGCRACGTRSNSGGEMAGYTIRSLEEIPDVLGDYPGEMRMSAASDLGTEQVGFTWRRMPPLTGGKGSYGHRHRTQEEVYFVASGTLQFKLEDEVIDVAEGTVVRVSPEVARSVWNAGPGRRDPDRGVDEVRGPARGHRDGRGLLAGGRVELPPGPRAPAAWQTVGWTVRPAAFLRRVHRRFGDPVTIRTFWTEEPMVLFSHPDAVRELFRLDPGRRAGRPELGVPAAVRGRSLDPPARRRRAHPRAQADPGAVPRRADARASSRWSPSWRARSSTAGAGAS